MLKFNFEFSYLEICVFLGVSIFCFLFIRFCCLIGNAFKHSHNEDDLGDEIAEIIDSFINADENEDGYQLIPRIKALINKEKSKSYKEGFHNGQKAKITVVPANVFNQEDDDKDLVHFKNDNL